MCGEEKREKWELELKVRGRGENLREDEKRKNKKKLGKLGWRKEREVKIRVANGKIGGNFFFIFNIEIHF